MLNYGTIFIVATPIGNLEDITIRALNTLKTVDIIVCEDTRVTSKLLNHYNIAKPLISYNNFNEQQKTNLILAKLQEGSDIALVSDAGTPLISDPGFLLVNSCLKNNIKIVTLPGPCSVIAALTISGLPLHNFLFLGFLSKSSFKKQQLLAQYKNSDLTLIFFESPHRLISTLEDIQEVFAEKQQVVIIRELTKLYEEVKKDSLEQLINYYNSNPPKGEIIISFHASHSPVTSQDNLLQLIKKDITNLSPAVLSKKLAQELKIDRTIIYNEIIKLKQDGS